jgi:hypothetical protein
MKGCELVFNRCQWLLIMRQYARTSHPHETGRQGSRGESALVCVLYSTKIGVSISTTRYRKAQKCSLAEQEDLEQHSNLRC